MHRFGRMFLTALVIAVALHLPYTSAIGSVDAQAASDLEDAIRLYALPLGFVLRGECATVPADETTGMCYEATIRADGDAEVWITDLASGDSAIVLFGNGNPGWYPFTPGLVVSDGPGINTQAQWADVAGVWITNGALQGTGYPGIGNADIRGDGRGSIGAGRFDVARLQLSNLQDGIAVGSITMVRDNVNSSTNAISNVTDVRSAPCAVVVLNDGSIVISSVMYGENWFFTRSS